MKRRIATWLIGVCLLLVAGRALPAVYVIVTDPATDVSTTSAVLNGHISCFVSGSYNVRFGVGTASGTYTDFYDADQSPISGDGSTYYVTRTVTGLTSGQPYYYVVYLDFSGWIPSATEQTFTTDAALSVDLASFTAQTTRQGILLRWTTQSECGNLGFTIERKESDSVAWSAVSDYASNPNLKGRGNSSGPSDYSYLDIAVQSGYTYDYRISETDADGKTAVKSQIRVTFAKAPLPSETALDPAFPNPFNPETRISFRLAEDARVSLSVLDLNGRKVRTLMAPADRSAGRYDFNWNATDDSNRRVGCGLYLILLRAGGTVQTRKVLLIK